ncbi:transglutaminase domain-containing protein [Pseudomonas sp. LPH60]|uniref:transglutaminase domain-containing protein n=1 Tax=Pseudomonas sp. LPH60 TaxID=3065906 RepID=UPI00273B4211|nr:transglutaminase domain-containing protein [Pseudomonas sp. LPH60]MDP4568278.1 transglutaminase domain-containing protein [Pseudomonas sp. LPH60]
MTSLALVRQPLAQAVLDNLGKVEDHHRRFSVAAGEAGLYGFVDSDLQALKSIGLVSRIQEHDEFFDPDDLYSLSLHLRLPSLHKLAMRSWATAFRQSDRQRQVELVYTLNEKQPPQGPIQVLTAAERLCVLEAPQGGDFYRQCLVIPGQMRLLPSPFRELIEEVSAGMQFYMLHDGVRWDLEFMSRHKLAECGGFSKLLVERAKALGLPARQVFGLLLSSPYATGHYWAELQICGEWIAVDPLMIRLLSQQAGLVCDQWPLHRSPLGALLRLCVVESYDHNGAPCLSCFEDKYFRQLPVATAGTTQYQVSYRVAVQLPV